MVDICDMAVLVVGGRRDRFQLNVGHREGCIV